MKMLGGASLIGNEVRMTKRGLQFEFVDLADLRQQMEQSAEIVRGNMENFRRASAVVRTAQLLALLAVSDARGNADCGLQIAERDPASTIADNSSTLSGAKSLSAIRNPQSAMASLSVFGIGGVGCRIENANYWQDYAQNGRTMGRSSLFVSTLNSTPLCEAAITVGAQGSIRYVDDSTEVENFLDFHPEALVLAMSIFPERAAAGVFCRGVGNGFKAMLT